MFFKFKIKKFFPKIVQNFNVLKNTTLINKHWRLKKKPPMFKKLFFKKTSKILIFFNLNNFPLNRLFLDNHYNAIFLLLFHFSVKLNQDLNE